MCEEAKIRHSEVEVKIMDMKRGNALLLCFVLSAILSMLMFGLFVSITYASDLNRAHMSVTPSSGKAPLEVKVNISAESQLLCTAFEIDWGDNSPKERYDPGIYEKSCYGGKFSRKFTHTYATSSIYTIKAKAGSDSLDQLNTMSLPVAVYGSDWSGGVATTTEKYCFVNPSSGYVPFVTAAYVPLGGALCDGTYEYYIVWGDGYESESRFCDNTANHYDVFYHEYATSSDYTAKIVRMHGTSTIPVETCAVSVTNAPQITITKPSWDGEVAVIGKPFPLEWTIENAPGSKNAVEPNVRLMFITQSGQAGFIADVDIGTTNYEWTPTSEPCLTGVCQSSIEEGEYYISASIIYDICSGDPYCGKPIPTATSYTTTEAITVSATGDPTTSWLSSVRDRMFAHPMVSSAPAIIYFTTVLNSEASCHGGVYTIEYGDGESSSLAYPRGKCAAFASSFTHSYASPGSYKVKLSKNGVESASLFITITNPPTARSTTASLASAWTAFTKLLTRLFSF